MTVSKLVSRAVQARAAARAFWLARRHATTFGRAPVLVVVGARYGVPFVGRTMARAGVLRVIGFEPDEQECTRLRRKQPFVRFESTALGAADGPQALYITAHPGCSSCLEPNPSVLDAYPIRDWFRVERKAMVDLRRYDSLRGARDLPSPDFIQIDVQGFEAQALAGFGTALDTVVGIEAESHLREIYRGQSVLTDLRDLLGPHGLLLRHIRPQGAFEGETVELNVWFTRRRDACTPEQRSLAAIWETMCMVPPAECFVG